VAIDLRDGGGRGDDAGHGRRSSTGARVVVFHDNDRIWLANLGEVPALDIELDVDERASGELVDLLTGLHARTLSAYEQRCVPATPLPPDGVLLGVGWRDHLGGEHRTLQLVGRHRVTRLEIPDAVTGADRSRFSAPT